jgi:hypothetical protein
LQLAKENWVVQREIADVRILLEAALATGDAPTIVIVNTWLRESQLEDIAIERLEQTTLHPDPGPIRTKQRP